ncbi:MAG TPA: FumA C-terminus/TtdB family hydratase beta subunit [Phycisphaerae bacterium]|nr:TRZ/ATZ family protein [Phycisphaerae bacterium]HOI56232.1 FumA C-terminus/TtdB family hydratase beta subunit [Phycisphaerae bacterium]
MGTVTLHPPLSKDVVRGLVAGDEVRITGTVYAARDAAHARMVKALEAGQPLPLPLPGAILYYVGPTPGGPGQVFGAAGPTTAGRMDRYAPTLIEQGLAAMVGKGDRSGEVVEAMKRCGAVYLAATGGAGALLAKCITAQRVLAYEELGPEALRELTVTDFPALVAIDSHGRSLYRR